MLTVRVPGSTLVAHPGILGLDLQLGAPWTLRAPAAPAVPLRFLKNSEDFPAPREHKPTVASSELFHSKGEHKLAPVQLFLSHSRMSKELSLLEADRAMADCRYGTWQPPGSCMNWEQPSCPGMAPHSFSLISLKGVGAYPEPCLVFTSWRHILPSRVV